MSKFRSEILISYTLIFMVAGLIAIWPLPQTMALRNFFYLSGLFCSFYLIQREGLRSLRLELSTHWPIFLFFSWTVFHWIVFSQDQGAQYRELTGFWLRCFIASLLGMSLGAYIYKQDEIKNTRFSRNSKIILFASLFGTLVIFILRYIYEVISTGILLHSNFYMTPFNGKPQVVIFISVLITAIFSVFPSSFKTKNNQILATVGLLTVIFCMFVFYVANTKNGFLIFTLLSTAFIVKNFHWRLNYKKMLFIILSCSVFIVIIYSHAKVNPAWKTVIPDIKSGFNIDQQNYWKDWINNPEPTNEIGLPVNQSTYLRTAWFRAAIDLIKDNPQGYGLMSYSFSYLAKKKWPDFYSQENDHMVATHSGWTDLTLALGLPALLLVQFSWWRSFYRAGKLGGFWYRYIRWTVPTITFMYLTVEVSYDIFFELLFLLLGLFGALTNPKKPSETQATHLA